MLPPLFIVTALVAAGSTRHMIKSIQAWLRATAVLTAIVFAFAGNAALAQRSKKDAPVNDAIPELKNGRKDVKAKLSPRGSKALGKAVDLLNEEKYDQAMNEVEKLLAGKTSEYETSKAYQVKANILYYQDDYAGAIAAGQQAIAADGLNNKEQLEVLLLVAQLTANLEEPDPAQSLQAYQAYADAAPTVKGEIYAAMANVQYNAEQWDAAVQYIDQALATGDKASDSWYQIKVNALYQAEKFGDAVSFLKELLAREPGNMQFNNLLVSSYLQMDDNAGALAHLLQMKAANLFDTPLLWTQLYQLYLHQDQPLKSAEIIQEGLASGGLHPSGDLYVDLGENYFVAADNVGEADKAGRAQYMQLALDAFAQAAALDASKGNADLWRCQILLDQDQAANAADACGAALSKGGLRDEGNAHYLHGVALFESGKVAEARAALNKALGFDNSRKNAESMLQNLR